MLISLSSHDEVNPARFSNYFSTPTIVKPYSYVCLVQAGLIRNKNQKIATVPPDFEVNVRFNAYNTHQLILNQGGGGNVLYTIPQLVAALNTARPQQAQQQVDGFYEFITSNTAGYAFELRFFNQSITQFIKQHIYGANGEFYGKQFWNLISGDTDTNPTSQNGANRQAFPAVTGTWGFGMAWDEAYYTPPNNQFNKNTPSILLSQNPAYNNESVAQFQIANNNINGIVTCGHAVSNTATPPLYISGPYDGSPNNGYENRRVEFQFDDVRGLDCRVYNKATNSLETITSAGGVVINPGDKILCLATNLTAPQPTGQDDLGYYTIAIEFSKRMVYMYNGILGELANRPAGNNYLLSTNVTSPTDQTASNNMSYVYDNDVLNVLAEDSRVDQFIPDFKTYFNGNNNQSWVGNTVIGICAGIGSRDNLSDNYIGVNAGWIYDQSLGRPATFPFLNSGETQIASAQIRNATGVWGFNTFADGVQRASTQVEIPNVFRIQEEIYRFNCPTMIQVHTCFGDTTGMYDAGDLLTSHRVLFARNNQSGIVVALNQTETWDVEWFGEGRNPALPVVGLKLNLTDPSNNRINIRPSSNAGTSYNYTWWFQYFGNNGTFDVRVYCNEQTRTAGGAATNVLYSSPITSLPVNMTQPIGLNYMGGANPLDPFFLGGGGAVQYRYYNMSENTIFSHLRIYQNSDSSTIDNTIWDNFFNQLYLNYQGDFTDAEAPGLFPVNAGLPNEAFMLDPRVETLFPTAAHQANIENYTTIPYPQPENTSTWFFRKPENDGPNDQGVSYHRLNAYDFANIQIDNYITCPLNSTIKTLNASSYAGTGQGITQPSADFETVIDVETPAQNPDGNYFQNQEYEPDEGVNHPVSTMTMDLDVLDIPSEKLKVQLTNLPHNSINGVTNSLDKTIYEIPLIENIAEDNEHEVVEITAPTKCWIPLNNAGEIPLNQIDVRIADVENKEATNLTKDTNILIQIEDDFRLLN